MVHHLLLQRISYANLYIYKIISTGRNFLYPKKYASHLMHHIFFSFGISEISIKIVKYINLV